MIPFTAGCQGFEPPTVEPTCQPPTDLPWLSPLKAGLRIACLVGLCVAGSGCRLAGRTASAPVDVYQDVRIVYDLSGQYRDLPIDCGGARPTDLSLVGHEAPTTPIERWTSAKLAIEYPHPEGKPDFARATLRLSGHVSKPRPVTSSDSGRLMTSVPDVFSDTEGDLPLTSARDDEVWVLDFPRAQLDLLVGDLKTCGFFESQLRPDPGTRLEVVIDRARTAKNWTPEPRLDDFVARVHREGHLGGFLSRGDKPADDAVASGGW